MRPPETKLRKISASYDDTREAEANEEDHKGVRHSGEA